jgi:hypothetical protein
MKNSKLAVVLVMAFLSVALSRVAVAQADHDVPSPRRSSGSVTTYAARRGPKTELGNFNFPSHQLRAGEALTLPVS